MEKFGLVLPSSHWSASEEIMASQASKAVKMSALEDWARVTASLAKDRFEKERQSGKRVSSYEPLVKSFCRVLVFWIKRHDLLTLTFVLDALGCGSRTSIIKWIEDIKSELVREASRSVLLERVPVEIQLASAEFISEIWSLSQSSAAKQTPYGQSEENELRKLSEDLRAKNEQQSQLIDQLRAKVDSLSRELSETRINFKVSEEKARMALESLDEERTRFNEVVEDLRTSQRIAEERKNYALLEIDKAREASKPLEAKVKKLERALADESVMLGSFRQRANELELELARLKSSSQEL